MSNNLSYKKDAGWILQLYQLDIKDWCYSSICLAKWSNAKNFHYEIIEKLARWHVINKGYFFEAFLFKLQIGRSPPSCLNRKPRENPLFSFKYGTGANGHMLLTPDEIYIRSSLHPA